MRYIKPVVNFIGCYIFKLGILDGRMGYNAAKYISLSKYIKYNELYRLQKLKK